MPSKFNVTKFERPIRHNSINKLLVQLYDKFKDYLKTQIKFAKLLESFERNKSDKMRPGWELSYGK